MPWEWPGFGVRQTLMGEVRIAEGDVAPVGVGIRDDDGL